MKILTLTGLLLLNLFTGSYALADSQQILITVARTAEQDKAILRTFNRNYHVTNDYGSELQVKRQIKEIAQDYNLVVSENAWTIKSLDIYCALLEIPEHLDMQAMLDKLNKDHRVESAQPVFDYALQGKQSYNDPYFSVQYKNRQTLIQELHQQTTGKGVKVAVIDTGADMEHKDLNQQIKNYRNFVDDDIKQFNADIHGTAIAGIIAAEGNNSTGIVGIAPDVDLWILKACWQPNEKSSSGQCNSFTVANALSIGIDENIDIFNISLSGPRDPLVERLIEVAIKKGIIVVAADPIESDHRYPALLSGVIDVKQTPSNSQETASIDDTNSVHVNGVDILTTAPNGHFDFFSGSSMSTAIVTAVTALLIERDGEMNMDELKTIVNKTF